MKRRRIESNYERIREMYATGVVDLDGFVALVEIELRAYPNGRPGTSPEDCARRWAESAYAKADNYRA